MGGRPVVGVGGWVQWRAIRRRCHRSTVSGLTIRNGGSRSSTVHRSEECSVGVVESRPADLALENVELVAKGEDLGVARVAGSE